MMILIALLIAALIAITAVGVRLTYTQLLQLERLAALADEQAQRLTRLEALAVAHDQRLSKQDEIRSALATGDGKSWLRQRLKERGLLVTSAKAKS